MNQDIILSDEDFKRIYTDENFRNAVAYAHQQCNARGNFIHYIALAYQLRYIVSEEQITEAKELLRRAKIKIFNDHSNDLLFCSMGGSYPARYEDDVCNHRIRTEFLNKDGRRFFIEFGNVRGDNLRIDHSIDRDMENEYKIKSNLAFIERKKHTFRSDKWELCDLEVKKYQGQPYHNYAGLEHLDEPIKYTRQNILNIVNEKFDCNFKAIIIDQNTIHPDDSEIICSSPKSEQKAAPLQLSMAF